MKVDLVYLWVDGNDPEWNAKKNFHLHGIDFSNKEVFNEARFANNDELMYSLRSIEMYAPWINHIFIITDNQIPAWLDTNNEKISIIDHKDIMPHDALPCFNSQALELAICNIPSLSEHFLYANDDMLFGRALSKEYFFTSEGKVKCHFSYASEDYNTQIEANVFQYAVAIANQTMANEYSRADFLNYIPHHQIDAYFKSNIKEFKNKYPEWVSETLHHKFRQHTDIQRHIFSLYAVATGRGETMLKQEGRIRKSLDRAKVLLSLMPGIESKFISLNQPWRKAMAQIKRYKPGLLCFNDVPTASSEQRKRLPIALNKMYPHKSQFEL